MSRAAQIVAKLSDEQVISLLYDWTLKARLSQLLPPGNWQNWLILAGRGWGKTRTGAEAVKQWVYEGKSDIIHLVGATAADVRDIMVKGESGLLNVFHPQDRPIYKSSQRLLEFHNGAKALLFSAEEPDRLRGPQCHKAWCDEIAAWKYPETYDMLLMGLRLGDHPQNIITTTPRPTSLIKELVKDEETHVTTGNTFENQENLSDKFIELVKKRYEGTTLGRQELYAEILQDIAGALWKQKDIDKGKVSRHPHLKRIVVGLDPSGKNKADSDEAGIVVAGIAEDDHLYILQDESAILSPNDWARKAVELYHHYQADAIIAEVNAGWDMVSTIIRNIDRLVNVRQVVASRGKDIRAEPIAALYEQGRAHHVGSFAKLENEMTTWVPGLGMRSPNRIDALVWALSALYKHPTAANKVQRHRHKRRTNTYTR